MINNPVFSVDRRSQSIEAASAHEFCEFLTWDSSFFARRIARLKPDRLDARLLSDALGWCRTNAIDCLYFLADGNDPRTSMLAEDSGFGMVDVRITLQRRSQHGTFRPRQEPDPGVVVRPFRPADLPSLIPIAGASHTSSRFFFDRNFPRASCVALYETWLRKSCAGSAPLVLVGEVDGRSVGYLSCGLQPEGGGSLELLGVETSSKRRGVGSALVQAALDWFAEKGVEIVKVATQARSVGALRLYERHGFLTSTVQIWYHKWFKHHRVVSH